PDAELEAKAKALSSRPGMAGVLEIPDRLPIYVDRVASAAADMVVRPIANDSISFRLLGQEQDLAVGGLNDLIGCRATGCLWIRNDPEPEVMFVPTARLAGRRGEAPPR